MERGVWKFRGAQARKQLWLGKSYKKGLVEDVSYLKGEARKAFQVKGILIGPSFRKHWAYTKNIVMAPPPLSLRPINYLAFPNYCKPEISPGMLFCFSFTPELE